MEKHNLVLLSDLVQPRFEGHGIGINELILTRQNISERLFFSGQAIAQKLFTAYSFPFDECWDDGIFVLNNCIKLGQYGLLPSFSRDFYKNINIALQNPDVLVDIYGHGCRYKTRKLIDVVLGSKMFELGVGLNLLTDQLFYPRIQTNYELMFYRPQDYAMENFIQESNQYQDLLNLFIQRIDSQDAGWVEILPYNENLIFLKGKNGEYDFVFKNQRDNEFNHQIYAPYLKRAEIPKFDDTYHFQRWYYFEFSGFRQEIEHKAEQKFYAENPREDYWKSDIVKEYLANQYRRTEKKISSELDGFKKIKLKNGKTLMVSDLVSIQEFEIFKSENSDYFERRSQRSNLDNLDSVNRESDKSLPVTLTGYDVWKYIHWFNEKYGVETRLLDDVEYKEISPFSSIDWEKEKAKKLSNISNIYELIEEQKRRREAVDLEEIQNIAFISSSGELSCSIPYMEEEDFQDFTFSFINPKFECQHGLKFMKSGRFAEWLKTKHCIRSYLLTGWDSIGVNESIPPFTSTGKYHYIKIGFRLCYELG